MQTNFDELNFNLQDDYKNLYQFINDGNDMAKWLAYRLHNGHDDIEWKIENYSDTFVDGFLDDFMFRVEIYDKSRVFLKIEDGNDEETNRLVDIMKKIIAPTIWHLGKKNKDKNVFRAEILEYSIGGYSTQNEELQIFDNSAYITQEFTIPIKVVAWDVEKPLELITDLVKKHLEGEIKVSSIECYYPSADLESIMEDLYYGAYSECIDDSYAKHVQTCSEFELFYTIKVIKDEITKFSNQIRKGEHLDNRDMTIIKNYAYLYEYLVQQCRRFGIRVGFPDSKLGGQTVEFSAWYAWWEEGYNELLKENPKILEEWETTKAGFDLSFKPKTSFEDFITKFRNSILEEEMRKKVRQEEFLRVKRKISPEERQRIREIRNARSKTVMGRAKNLLDNLKEHTAKQITKDEKNKQSPYDYI